MTWIKLLREAETVDDIRLNKRLVLDDLLSSRLSSVGSKDVSRLLFEALLVEE